MSETRGSDPAEKNPVLRLFYRNWRPTRLGRWVNRLASWWSGVGLVRGVTAELEVRGRVSGEVRASPVVIATLHGDRYLVSILGPDSGWVKNVEAARGEAVLHQGDRQAVRLVPVSPGERAPVLRAYVRVAPSGRAHLPVRVDAPLAEFEAIADRYPVYRIDPRT